MLKQLFTRQFGLFLIAGGTAAIVNFASRIFYSQWLSFSTAIILAYLTGMITAFVLSKWFVFTNSRCKVPYSLLIFSLVNMVAIAQTWVISLLLAEQILPQLGVSHFKLEISHAIGVAVPVLTSYFGHKNITFRE